MTSSTQMRFLTISTVSVILEISLCFPHRALAIYPGVDSKTTLSPFLTSSHPAEGTISLEFKMHTMTPGHRSRLQKNRQSFMQREGKEFLFSYGEGK